MLTASPEDWRDQQHELVKRLERNNKVSDWVASRALVAIDVGFAAYCLEWCQQLDREEQGKVQGANGEGAPQKPAEPAVRYGPIMWGSGVLGGGLGAGGGAM